jgi:hypothetical protein
VTPDEGGDESICGLLMGYAKVKNVLYKSIRRKVMKRGRRFGLVLGSILVGALLLIISGMVLAAAVNIDTFDDGNGLGGESSVCDDASYNGCYRTLPFFPYSYIQPMTSTTDVGTGVLGGERDMVVTQTAGSGTVNIYVNQGSSEILRLAQDPSTGGRGQLQWDGDDNSLALDPNGLSGADLTDNNTNNGIQLLVSFADGDFDLMVSVFTGTNYSTYTLSLLNDVSTPGQSFFIPFSDFNVAGGTGADFSSVGAVTFDIIPQELAVDLELDLIEATANTDWGDLPDTYSTTLSADGPRHTISGTLYLGSQVDYEATGVPDAGALGDDSANFTDEDGIKRQPGYQWVAGNTVYITATVGGSGGYLVGWFDWNNNDVFDSGEMVDFGSVSVGDNSLSLTVGGDYSVQQELYARFRLYESDPGTPQYWGNVDGGEVEDYYWGTDRWDPNAVTLSAIDAGPALAGWPAFALVVAMVAGGAGLFVWKRRA